MTDYDVIIVGGGPVGIALGIELGMTNVKTAINQKYYYLLRPDWHIAWRGEAFPNDLEEFINYLMPH